VTEGAGREADGWGMRADRVTRKRAKALRWPMTPTEVIIWTRVQRGRLSGFHFRKQHPLTPYIVDFACVQSRVIVEIDGETHWREFERRRDAARTALLEGEGWSILRVWNGDVYENEDGVIETILRWVSEGQERELGAGRVRRERTRRVGKR
jgi:very-short-patch-repair endonuclease